MLIETADQIAQEHTSIPSTKLKVFPVRSLLFLLPDSNWCITNILNFHRRYCHHLCLLLCCLYQIWQKNPSFLFYWTLWFGWPDPFYEAHQWPQHQWCWHLTAPCCPFSVELHLLQQELTSCASWSSYLNPQLPQPPPTLNLWVGPMTMTNRTKV